MKNILSCILLSFVFIGGLYGQNNNASTPAPGPAGNYIIQPLDIFRVTVFQEPDLESEVRVSKDGTVALPLIGKINVAGMTVLDAQHMIRELYNRDYLVKPHVTLMMLQYTERRIQVHGQVNQPGPVVIPPEEEMTLSQALSAAGGLTRLASSSNILVKRVDEQGKSKVIRIDFDEILKDPQAKDIKMREGDNIFVQERIF